MLFIVSRTGRRNHPNLLGISEGRNPSGALVLSRDLGLIVAPGQQVKDLRDGRTEAPLATG
jgi:hypothetical protein